MKLDRPAGWSAAAISRPSAVVTIKFAGAASPHLRELTESPIFGSSFNRPSANRSLIFGRSFTRCPADRSHKWVTWDNPKPGRRKLAGPEAFRRYTAGEAGGAVVAQRMACTSAWPTGRTTVASATGSGGRRRCQRAHQGSSDTAAAASTP
jgi:hypothetical protein